LLPHARCQLKLRTRRIILAKALDKEKDGKIRDIRHSNRLDDPPKDHDNLVREIRD
jgi:hypothetical protein